MREQVQAAAVMGVSPHAMIQAWHRLEVVIEDFRASLEQSVDRRWWRQTP